MAIDPQFMQALQMIGQAGQQFAIGQQMNEINERAQAIRDSIMPDIEKRRAMQQLAQMSSISVAGSGGSTQQLASLQNLIPPTPNNAVQAILQGQLSGDQQMVQVGQEILRQEEQRELRKFDMQLNKQLQVQAQQAGLMEQRDIKKENAKKIADIQKLKAAAEQSLLKAARAKKLIQEANGFAGTGPIDQYLIRSTPYGQLIDQALADIRVDKIMEFAKTAGAQSINTAAEQENLAKAIPNPSLYESKNIEILERQMEAYRGIIAKANASEEAYKMTKGMDLDYESLGIAPRSAQVSGGKYRPQGRPNNGLILFTPERK